MLYMVQNYNIFFQGKLFGGCVLFLCDLLKIKTELINIDVIVKCYKICNTWLFTQEHHWHATDEPLYLIQNVQFFVFPPIFPSSLWENLKMIHYDCNIISFLVFLFDSCQLTYFWPQTRNNVIANVCNMVIHYKYCNHS